MDNDTLRSRFERLEPFLDERGRRLFAANEALSLGRGGVSAVAMATGIARSTINRGMAELNKSINEIGKRIRRPGAGRPRAEEAQHGLLEAIESLVDDAIRGDPEAVLRWISRSQRNITKALIDKGFAVSQKLVGRLLRDLGYSCQANSKTREGSHSPDRNSQFEYIGNVTKKAISDGEPVISVDTKKKELVGDFKNAGQELRRKGDPEAVRVHDFAIKELGKVAPYGVYDVAANQGWVNVGVDADTAAFAVESIRRWWLRIGKLRYPAATRLHITADCGGSNGVRVRLWKWELQRLANEIGIEIIVTHLPPGTSKWNKIEHRMFSFISQNWRGKPLVSHLVILQLIGATKTDGGLIITCDIDQNSYPRGVKVSDEQMAEINIEPHAFRGDWNYTIKPQSSGP